MQTERIQTRLRMRTVWSVSTMFAVYIYKRYLDELGKHWPIRIAVQQGPVFRSSHISCYFPLA